MISEITNAVQALKNGQVILYPTDTVWGLGCDVRNTEAVNKIYQLKKREPDKPFVVGIGQIEQLRDYVQTVPDIAWDIVEFAEKPLTVIYPKGKNVAPSLLGTDGSIAVRLLKDEFCQQLIRKFGRGIVYTSANRHFEAKPRNLEDVDPEIASGVDYVVKLRQREDNHFKLSTIIRLEVNGQIKFIRK